MSNGFRRDGKSFMSERESVQRAKRATHKRRSSLNDAIPDASARTPKGTMV